MERNMEGELTVSETCRRLEGISMDYCYRLIWSGKLPARKDADGVWRVSASAVEERAAKRRMKLAA